MVSSYHRQDFIQDIADLDITQSECPALNTKDKMLHPEREDLFVNYCAGLSATLYH